MKPYERFEAWRESHQLVLLIYRITQAFPKHELYGLTSQVRRAAFAVPANIAEGSAKRGSREFRRYLDIAVGSLSELAYGLQLAKDLGLIDNDTWTALDRQRELAARLTWGLYASIRRSAGRQPVSPPARPLS